MSDDLSSRQSHISELFANLPTQPDECINQLLLISESFHENLARNLEPILNAKLSSLPARSIDEKSDLSTWTNALLRRFHLSIRDQSGAEAILVADRRNDRDDGGRFRLEVRDSQRKLIRTLTSVTVPTLALCVAPPRREGFARFGRGESQTR